MIFQFHIYFTLSITKWQKEKIICYGSMFLWFNKKRSDYKSACLPFDFNINIKYGFTFKSHHSAEFCRNVSAVSIWIIMWWNHYSHFAARHSVYLRWTFLLSWWLWAAVLCNFDWQLVQILYRLKLNGLGEWYMFSANEYTWETLICRWFCVHMKRVILSNNFQLFIDFG